MKVTLLLRAVLLAAVFLLSSAVEDAAPFDKNELEAVLRKEHSQRISNVYDSANGIQYTWHIERQELCPGVDGKCEKDEL